jgi:hypothetical protein
MIEASTEGTLTQSSRLSGVDHTTDSKMTPADMQPARPLSFGSHIEELLPNIKEHLEAVANGGELPDIPLPIVANPDIADPADGGQLTPYFAEETRPSHSSEHNGYFDVPARPTLERKPTPIATLQRQELPVSFALRVSDQQGTDGSEDGIFTPKESMSSPPAQHEVIDTSDGTIHEQEAVQPLSPVENATTESLVGKDDSAETQQEHSAGTHAEQVEVLIRSSPTPAPSLASVPLASEHQLHRVYENPAVIHEAELQTNNLPSPTQSENMLGSPKISQSAPQQLTFPLKPVGADAWPASLSTPVAAIMTGAEEDEGDGDDQSTNSSAASEVSSLSEIKDNSTGSSGTYQVKDTNPELHMATAIDDSPPKQR